ncbi:PhzF family phenazine biosynthesis protein [Clostridium fungisolvens]|uniref:Putative isomerase YddE n=1 Tax=Clostridium fungisolvens TaxID=1604897 RepID=A0A6V8SCN3_9CLOT|nr:PhzF family phenazine biosynthesis protein [Clostridium fungisolvens]GFP74820.1 putative isomerase YddE [Clostridium fungisolvens]
MKSISVYTVDSFANEIFKGNPAGVCILNEELEDSTMQLIAKELKFSETAFIMAFKDNIYSIRWFTPQHEVDICGHATLAASHVLFNEIKIPFDSILYSSNKGIIKACKEDNEEISLDFQIDEPESNIPFNYEEVIKSLGINKYVNVFCGKLTGKLVFELENEEEIRVVKPDFHSMKDIRIEGLKGVGITASSDNEYDFVTRYFNPWAGVNEDYVTGSVHTLLAQYWSSKKDKNFLKAKQLSSREGELNLNILTNGRVKLSGRAVLVLKGEMFI